MIFNQCSQEIISIQLFIVVWVPKVLQIPEHKSFHKFVSVPLQSQKVLWVLLNRGKMNLNSVFINENFIIMLEIELL